jgi:hypothetical protein
MTAKDAEGTVEYVPPLEADRMDVEVPVVEVVVLEDRAVVKRRGAVALEAGTNRVRIPGVAPVLQDVSLRAQIADEPKGVRVTDGRICRALRVRRRDKPEAVAALEARIRETVERFTEVSETRVRAEQRFAKVADMLAKGANEIPDDAAWGIVDLNAWSQTFASLFGRARELERIALDAHHAQQDLLRDHEQLVTQRRLLERPDQSLKAWAELDVVAETAGEVVLEVEYVVPNALWRPLHRAELTGAEGHSPQLAFTARAAIWQNTGEDWSDVQLVLSTARSSLGTEPPLLSDDLLEAQRRQETVQVQAREVAVDRAPRGGGGPAPGEGIELPGVDDGGEIRNLRPEDGGRVTVPSDGAPVFVDLFGFANAPRCTRVAMPEVESRVVLKCEATHTGNDPVLAGPVELVRDAGTVGWTEILFVAPGAPFELGFGTVDAVRVARTERTASQKQDPVDRWTRRQTRLELFLSNLSGEPQTVEVTERIPVSEIEHVKVAVDESHTTGDPTVDDDGFVTWTTTLEPHGRSRLKLGWELALAPDVEGLL